MEIPQQQEKQIFFANKLVLHWNKKMVLSLTGAVSSRIFHRRLSVQWNTDGKHIELFTLKRWVTLIEQTTMNYFTGLLKLNTFGEQAILYLSCGVLSTLAASTSTNISYITEWIPNDVKVLWLY